MSLFLTKAERLATGQPASAALLDAMEERVRFRAQTPGLNDPTATTEWWHHVAEYLTDAALVQAIRPATDIAGWLRAVVLDIARKPSSEWGGPAFRGYGGAKPVGTLETAHLTWGLAVTLDLVPDLFSAAEQTEIASALRENGLEPCRRYLQQTDFYHNWNCVLLAGFAVAAAVLNDDKAVAEAVEWFPLAADHFQPDGSYGESLQYGNYAAYSIILAREAILRRSPGTLLTLEPYARFVHWAAQSLFYRKPLSDWGDVARARSANFGDSGALFRPSGDLLVHIAVHGQKAEAGLARWLFDTLYLPANEPPPHDLASFGFLPGFGFLSVILLPAAAAPVAPSPTGLAAFSCGDVFAREGQTVLAARTASQPRHATAHIHGDINSFILVHRNERLLLDPGHSCYRNITHEIEMASLTHNTSTFDGVTQRGGINRPIGAVPIDLGGKRLIAEQRGPVTVIGNEAAPLYGAPLRSFARFWVLCGAHCLFIVDRIEADVPVRTTWHWLLNNRDGGLDLKLQPDRLLARRGDAGIQLAHLGTGQRSGPIHAHVHDAYHPRPAQRGEGRPGSGQLIRWTEPVASASRWVVHAICVDSAAVIADWNIAGTSIEGRERWTLRIDGDRLHIEETNSQQAFTIAGNSLTKDTKS